VEKIIKTEKQPLQKEFMESIFISFKASETSKENKQVIVIYGRSNMSIYNSSNMSIYDNTNFLLI
jgi:hypothetical protein